MLDSPKQPAGPRLEHTSDTNGDLAGELERLRAELEAQRSQLEVERKLRQELEGSHLQKLQEHN